MTQVLQVAVATTAMLGSGSITNEVSLMKHAARTAIVGSLLFSIGTACSSSSSSPAGGACPTATDSSGDIKLAATAANNYSFTSTMHLATQSVAEQSILTFDWSAVTKDMYNRTIDPKVDIGTILVTIWGYTKDELETKINNDELVTEQRKAAGYYFTQNAVTQATTADLTSDGATPLPNGYLTTYFGAANYPSPANTFLVMIQHNAVTPGKDGRMLTTFGLSTDPSASKTVTLNNTSTTLDYQADFSKLTPTLVPAGNGKLLIDWSTMTTNALGHALVADDLMKITRVLVASYNQPVSDLQKDSNFIELESLATGLWESNADDIVSPQLSLSKLKNSSGSAFAGIDSSQTWILALECVDCLNPAPWYITVLEPCTK